MLKVCKSKMRFGLILIVSLMSWECLTIHEYPVKKELPKTVIGYYASWKSKEFDHNKVQYKYLTHLAHAFTKPDSEGNLIVDEGYIYPELNQAAHENNVKVIMSIGGWGNCEGFPGMSSSAENRKRFINQVLEFCKNNDYDGVDIDWEFVSNPEEQQNFVFFIKELSSALKAQNPPLQLTMAAPSGNYWGRWVNYEEVVDYFDYIGCMTYDYHGEWSDHSGHNSPLYTCGSDSCGSMNDSYTYLLERRVPLKKLLLGIPFFGRSFDCQDLYQEFEKSNYHGYFEIMDFIKSGWTYVWDDCSEVPYIKNKDNTEIISFDDDRSIAIKSKYIKEKGVAGIIIWELSLDYYKDASVLLEVIGKEFKND